MSRALVSALLWIPAVGCTYDATVRACPSTSIVSSYADPLAGDYELRFGSENLLRTIKPSGLGGSAHAYRIDLRPIFAESVAGTLRPLVGGLTVATDPSVSAGELQNSSGRVISVQVTEFTPTVVWTSDIGGTARSIVKIAIAATVDDTGRRLFGTTAEGDCEVNASTLTPSGLADLIGAASEHALRSALRQIGERLSNSTRLRGAPEHQPH